VPPGRAPAAVVIHRESTADRRYPQRHAELSTAKETKTLFGTGRKA
jgi:hypothetical protein